MPKAGECYNYLSFSAKCLCINYRWQYQLFGNLVLSLLLISFLYIPLHSSLSFGCLNVVLKGEFIMTMCRILLVVNMPAVLE